MKPSALPAFMATALLLACQPSNPVPVEYLAIKGATLFDGTGAIRPNSIIVIREGRIESVGGPELPIPEGAEMLDLSGKFITPGLVDAHVHFGQTGFFDGRPDALDIRDTLDYAELQSYLQLHPERYYEAYLRSGVTAVYDVGGYPWTLGLQAAAENNLNAPHVAAAGPLLTPVPDENLTAINTPAQKQLLNLKSPEFGREAVRQNSSLGSKGIKIWGLDLNNAAFMESLRAVAEEVERQQNTLIVHATDLDQAKEALRLGARVLVHSVDDKLVDDEFIALAKQARAVYCPTLVVVRGYLNAYKALQSDFVLADPNRAVDSGTRNLLQSAGLFYKYMPNPDGYTDMLTRMEASLSAMDSVMATNLKRVYEAGIPIAVSTDAGNPGTLHGISIYDEMEAMQRAGIPAAEILVMGTKIGAQTMGRGDDFGTLEAGKMADLVILEQDPTQDIAHMRSITHVMRGGRLRLVNQPFATTTNPE